MDAELEYFLAIANRKRIPVARIGISGEFLVTESQTNIGIANIDAALGSSTALVTTVAPHGIAVGEIMTIENNLTESAITTITGDGTTATVACAQPHALVDQGTVVIANNTAVFTDADATGDGSTATIVTTEPHGFADSASIDIGYTVAGVPSSITVGISSVTADGTTATVVTTSPHTFIDGQNVTISVPAGDGSIAQIYSNSPTSGNSEVYSPNLPNIGDSVTITGNGFDASLLSPTLHAAIVTGNGTTATAITSYGTLPPEFTSGTNIELTGLRAHGTMVQIASSGTTVSVLTFTAHSLAVGSSVTLHGITGPTSQTRFNGTWTVASVPNPGEFTFTAPFSSSITFNPSPATWNGVSGFNGSWVISSIGSITVSSHVYKTVSFANSVNVTTAGTPTYGTGGVITAVSSYNTSFTVSALGAGYFVIPYASGAGVSIFYGGQWETGAGLGGVQVITAIDDSLTFEYATIVTSSSTSGYATGTSGFDQTGVTITYQDANTFTYSCASDTAGVAVAGYNGSGLSGFNGTQIPITYIDGLTFSFLSGTQAVITGGNLNGASGFNASPVTVLTVPSSTTFTYKNQLAGVGGTALPYVYGLTSASGTIITFDLSYAGVTKTQLYWDQPAVFSTNGMVASSSGITVPIAGYYRIICRVELSGAVNTAYAFADILVDGVLTARSTCINMQNPPSEYWSVLVSDLVYLTANQTISILVTAFAPLNSGQIYAFGSGYSFTYLAAIYMSAGA